MAALFRHVLDVPLALLVLSAVAGCGPKSPKGQIPDQAQRLAQPQGGRFLYQAPDNGTFYIFDPQTGKVVHTLPVASGDRLVVLPEKNLIWHNGAFHRPGGARLSPNVNYQFYFLKGKD